MENQKVVTYSLLGQISDSETLFSGPLDIFIPLIKRVLHKLNLEGVHSGDNINLIKKKADVEYGVDFPRPVLKYILAGIKKEYPNNLNIAFNDDESFVIENFQFLDYEENIQKSLINVNIVQESFQKFCESNHINLDEYGSIFDFIDQNKIELSKYLSFTKAKHDSDFTNEALFADYFRSIPPLFEIIKDIYLGSIISTYLTYSPGRVNANVELLFDTNFILGLMDLNTPESTHTCRKLLEICNNYGYKFSIMPDTIEEISRLVNKKIETFDTSFISKNANKEDVLNACERRGLKPFQLMHFVDNIVKELRKYNIYVLNDVTKYRNDAKYSKIFGVFRKVRNSDFAALHDATAIQYVKAKRGGAIKEFDRVNCWFVNNSTKHDASNGDKIALSGYQPDSISADELISILWLSNPSIIPQKGEVSDIGLSALISVTLNASLPKANILRELEDNIYKYKNEDLTDSDVVRISQRISSRKLKNIEELNKLAQNDRKAFIQNIIKESNIEKEVQEAILSELRNYSINLSTKLESYNTKEKNLENERIGYLKTEEEYKEKILHKEIEHIKSINELRKYKRDEYIKRKIGDWRWATWKQILFVIGIYVIGFLGVYINSSFNIENVMRINFDPNTYNILVKIFAFSGTALVTFFSSILVMKYVNYSNIEAYSKRLIMPDELNDLPFP
ncbi:hypothetical protein [Leptospira stimsonii]|uniref:Uncharacterized protein n=1 Tax=Leptospira stimsonii TaxID=2202203 RepID=A0A8B3CL46_9LEPT|nr:hypothetical protein [Leptospira stimsonii]RHX83299.1 hypothetical protein DLM78_22625 [Leptospira stimsonii]